MSAAFAHNIAKVASINQVDPDLYKNGTSDGPSNDTSDTSVNNPSGNSSGSNNETDTSNGSDSGPSKTNQTTQTPVVIPPAQQYWYCSGGSLVGPVSSQPAGQKYDQWWDYEPATSPCYSANNVAVPVIKLECNTDNSTLRVRVFAYRNQHIRLYQNGTLIKSGYHPNTSKTLSYDRFKIGDKFRAYSMQAGSGKIVTHTAVCKPTCKGHIATIIGTAGNDTIKGTAGRDVIVGLGGDDIIHAGSGNDVICGGYGDDKLYPGGGDDKVYGGLGNDTISTSSGKDRYDGGHGTDFITYYSAPGNIYINLAKSSVSGSWAHNHTIVNFEGAGGSNVGNDRIYGTAGINKLMGYGGNDKIYGGNGPDTIYGHNGNDYLYGQNGSDKLIGGNGNDRIYGQAGSDKLYGQNGNDYLAPGEGVNQYSWGGDGNDRFIASNSRNYFSGGEGWDFTDYYSSPGGIYVDLSRQKIDRYKRSSWAYGDRINGIEQVRGSNKRSNKLVGSQARDILMGGTQRDYIYGNGGSDIIYGGGSWDYIYGGSGYDYCYTDTRKSRLNSCNWKKNYY